MMRDEVTEEGFRIRRITDLSLVRAQHPAFALGWTIMHVIDANESAQYGNGRIAACLGNHVYLRRERHG